MAKLIIPAMVVFYILLFAAMAVYEWIVEDAEDPRFDEMEEPHGSC